MMRLKNVFFNLLVFFTLLGCKNENNSSTNEQNQEDLSNSFKVTVNLISKETDDFCFLYTTDGSINFNEKGVWKEVKGSDGEQAVEFIFPKDTYPTQLRLDLGLKPDQQDIVIKSIKLEYDKNVRVLKGLELGAFFRADDTKCTFDYSTGIVKPKEVNGEKLNCSLYPHETVQGVELPKLFKK